MATLNSDYLIIGNSAAGVTAAETIRAKDPYGTITLISREPHHVYGRPLISYLIEGKTTLDAMKFKPETFYEDHKITALLGDEFEALTLDPEAHEVGLKNGDSIGYGRCLLATGSVPFTPPIKGLQGKSNVFTFITLDDAEQAWAAAVEASLKASESGRCSRVVVIGSGLIGLKAAEALSHHLDEISVLELADRILPTVLDPEGSALLQRLLEPHGITCYPGLTADEVLGEGDQAVGVRLTNGECLDCDLIIAAVGVRPNSSLALEAGAQSGRGLIVDERLLTSLPDVYAAGDVVQVCDVLDGSEHPLALWPNAMHQGKIAGRQMAGD